MSTIPPMLYGTAWKKERTADLVALALENGFRGIDTACQPKHYEEVLVGEGLAKFYQQGGKREEIFIQTKFTSLHVKFPSTISKQVILTLYSYIHHSFHTLIYSKHGEP